MTMSEIKLYTIEEVADLLKLSRRTIYRYLKDGKLKANKVGQSWRITETALNEFIGE